MHSTFDERIRPPERERDCCKVFLWPYFFQDASLGRRTAACPHADAHETVACFLRHNNYMYLSAPAHIGNLLGSYDETKKLFKLSNQVTTNQRH